MGAWLISGALNEFGGSQALGWVFVAGGGLCFVYAFLIWEPVQSRIPWRITSKTTDPRDYVANHLSQLIWLGSFVVSAKDDAEMAPRYQRFLDDTANFLRYAFNPLEATRFQGVARMAELREQPFDRRKMAQDSLARLEEIAMRFSTGELSVSSHFDPERWKWGERRLREAMEPLRREEEAE